MAHLILLEDEPILRHELAGFLVEHGHIVDAVGTAAEFHAAFAPANHMIAVVDLVLPDGDGIDLIDRLRGQGQRLGIVVISARCRTGDKVRGLAVGADYYLTKPVELEEFSAVVAALARRLDTGGVSLRWVLDAIRGELIPPGKAPVPLTAQGTLVLVAIARGGGEPVDRRCIVAVGRRFPAIRPTSAGYAGPSVAQGGARRFGCGTPAARHPQSWLPIPGRRRDQDLAEGCTLAGRSSALSECCARCGR